MNAQQLRRTIEGTYPKHVDYIVQQIKQNTLHHAVLFTGIREGGQRLLAEYAAAALLGVSDDSPLNRIHMDLLRIDPHAEGASLISLDEARSVRRHLKGSPNASEHKVVLLHEAELLNTQASNALLKIVEEPPVQSKILMTSSRMHMLPRTLLSRAQVIQVPLLTHDTIGALVKQHKKSHEAVEQIVHLASGRLLSATNMLFAEPDEKGSYQWWQQHISFWLEYLLATVPDRVALLSKRFPKDPNASAVSLATDLDIIQMIFHDILLLQNGVEGARTVRMNESALQLLQSRYTAAEIQQQLTLIDQLREMDAARVNTKRIVDYITTAL